METIKNYLEGMFASLPNTPEVLKAKHELFQMMEDKYNELIEEGKNDNEAIGVVISEFGNLDELSESLGIKEVTDEYQLTECRIIGRDEATDYVNAKRKQSIGLGLGILLCIVSVIAPILSGAFSFHDVIGACLMFIIVAIGVIFIVLSNVSLKKWSYIFKEPSQLDYATANFIKEERDRFSTGHALRLTAGIIMCALCWIPCAIFEDVFTASIFSNGDFAASLLFLMVGAGVFFIVQTNNEYAAYEKLLKLNGQVRISENAKDDGIPNYANPTVDIIMHVYWPTVTCIYLTWSFLSFRWGITWIVWVIASVVFGALKTVFRDEVR